MLNLLIQHNDQVLLTPDSLTRFHSKSAPDIKVLDYLNRIVKYTNMEVSPILLSARLVGDWVSWAIWLRRGPDVRPLRYEEVYNKRDGNIPCSMDH
jgi:hypothetical protein